jgi:GNAT superfamily N-acetyltransferase
MTLDNTLADKDYTAFLIDEPVGLIGVNTGVDGFGDGSVGGSVGGGVGRIEYVFVEKESRRRGYGAQLLGQAVSELRKLGRGQLLVEVAQSDASMMGYCAKYGFEASNEAATRRDNRVMVKEISN